jgi:hypothetical protein
LSLPSFSVTEPCCRLSPDGKEEEDAPFDIVAVERFGSDTISRNTK